MRYLFFDTETTGKADFKSALTADHQPHLIQLAFIHYDDVTQEEEQVMWYCKAPIKVPEEAQKIHGITDEILEKKGKPRVEVYERFYERLLTTDMVVAHNMQFDIFIMRILGMRLVKQIAKRNKLNLNLKCTMKSTTDFCKIPGKYGNKWPSLQEAYKILVDEAGFEGAHDALVDVRACKAVFFELQKRGIPIIS